MSFTRGRVSLLPPLRRDPRGSFGRGVSHKPAGLVRTPRHFDLTLTREILIQASTSSAANAIKPINPSNPFFEFADPGSEAHKDFVGKLFRSAPFGPQAAWDEWPGFQRRSFRRPMKRKNRKQGKHPQPAPRAVRTVRAKRRGSAKKNKGERASTAWLRLVPSGIEEEPRADDFREFSSHRNGRRQPRDLDLYIPEDHSKSR